MSSSKIYDEGIKSLFKNKSAQFLNINMSWIKVKVEINVREFLLKRNDKKKCF